MKQAKIALILGATGTIGGEVGRRLLARGWVVRALHRAPSTLDRRDERFEWRCGDAMVRDDVVAAAQGVDVIVHAVNPPGYRNWGKLVLPMIDNTIAAARARGARILLPGTVYNYGPSAFPKLSESSPQQALTRKGAIRVELERRLLAASDDGVRALVVRAGDFFGPGSTTNSWFAAGLVTPGKAVRAIRYPGKPGTGHQWAYVPDVAETMVRLLERDDLPTFASYHMRGHWDADGRQMVDAIRRVAGRAEIKVRAFPWWALWWLAPFSETLSELREMRYLWQESIHMENHLLRSILGEEPHTSWDEAVRVTLTSMKCI